MNYETNYKKGKTLILRIDQKTSNMLDQISSKYKNKSSCIRDLIEKDYKSKNKKNNHIIETEVNQFPFPDDFPL